MREHLFRGFHPDKNGKTEITLNGEKIKGEWQYWNEFGCLVDISDIAVIDVVVVAEIIKETVCEYSGLTGESGRMIFEGDIVYSYWHEENLAILWDNEFCRFVESATVDVKDEQWYSITNNSNSDGYKIIGNIFENPELLK